MVELQHNRIDICVISKTKNKGKESEYYYDYILVCSEKIKNTKSELGIGILVIYKFKDTITDINHKFSNKAPGKNF